MAYDRKQLINFVALIAETARVAGHFEDGRKCEAIIALLNFDEKFIADLSGHVRSLRSCLSVMAHPEHGWPLVEIADRYEASRELLPDGEGDDALDSLESVAHLQMANEWGAGESAPAGVVMEAK